MGEFVRSTGRLLGIFEVFIASFSLDGARYPNSHRRSVYSGTGTTNASEPDKSDEWENRKKHTIGMLKSLSRDAAILVLADKVDNSRAIREDLERNGENLWDRFNAPKVKQEWYYESLVSTFSSKLTDENSLPLVDLFRHEVIKVFG